MVVCGDLVDASPSRTAGSSSSNKEVDAQFDSLDSNKDGEVHKAEWVSKFGSEEGFESYDLNRDDILDAEEWRSVNATLRQRQTADWKIVFSEVSLYSLFQYSLFQRRTIEAPLVLHIMNNMLAGAVTYA